MEQDSLIRQQRSGEGMGRYRIQSPDFKLLTHRQMQEALFLSPPPAVMWEKKITLIYDTYCKEIEHMRARSVLVCLSFLRFQNLKSLNSMVDLTWKKGKKRTY